MSVRSSFADGLVELVMRETRARLAEAMAAAKVHPSWAEGIKGKLLQDSVSRVERELLTSARGAIQILDEALKAADFRPVPATAAEDYAQIVSALDADRPPPPVRQSPSRRPWAAIACRSPHRARACHPVPEDPRRRARRSVAPIKKHQSFQTEAPDMIKREFPLQKVPLAERPYPIEGFAVRPDGGVWMMRRYRGVDVQQGMWTTSGRWSYVLRNRERFADTLTDACDQIDAYMRRSAGQRRRHDARLAERATEEAEAVADIDYEDLHALLAAERVCAEISFGRLIRGDVDASSVSDLACFRDLLRCLRYVEDDLGQLMNGLNVERVIGYAARSEALYRRLAAASGERVDIHDGETASDIQYDSAHIQHA